MASTVTGETLPPITGTMQACEVSAALLETAKQVKMLVEYQYDDEGLPTTTFAREIGAIIMPPGTTLDIAVPVGTTYADVVTRIETMWLTDDEKTQYRDNKASVLPFWAVADNLQSNGAPDFAGRFKIQADFRAGDLSISGVTGIVAGLGSKDVTLSEEEMPTHTHKLIVPQAESTKADPKANRFLYTPGSAGGIGGNGENPDTWPTQATLVPATMGGGLPHNNMPPFVIVVVAWRTNRMT